LIFHRTDLQGSYLIEPERRVDDRGFFARTFCAEEFRRRGLTPTVEQCNLSFNHKRGTLRGLHYQIPPAAEAKLVRCTHGAIFDVIVDLRPNSPTFLQHFGVELSENNRFALYVPELFAHGYLTLTDDAEVAYQVSQRHTPEAERGIRYDDPALRKIDWPLAIEIVSEKDRAWPMFAFGQ
jgi:dTDP-4-dehydrorhamnose 3,5-epimerase